QIAKASARIFLLRARKPGTDGFGEEKVEEDGVTFFYGGFLHHLCWFEGPKFSACFMDWRRVGALDKPLTGDAGFCVPTRIHYHSSEGEYPYDLRMKLIRAEVLEKPPPDSLFEAK